MRRTIPGRRRWLFQRLVRFKISSSFTVALLATVAGYTDRDNSNNSSIFFFKHKVVCVNIYDYYQLSDLGSSPTSTQHVHSAHTVIRLQAVYSTPPLLRLLFTCIVHTVIMALVSIYHALILLKHATLRKYWQH